jgi:hypothetical protein
VKLALISACALAALPAAAQAVTPSLEAAAARPAQVMVVANVKAIGPQSATAGPAARLLIVADGIVAHTAVPQIGSPAPGFVYER